MKHLAIASSLIAVMLLTGCAATAPKAKPTPTTLTVTGMLALTDASSVFDQGTTCLVVGNGYADIKEGAPVVITDASGKTIALGALDPGKADASDSSTCDFPFTLKGVPDGQKFYGIQISHRGIVQYTRGQMIDSPTLTLGN